MTISQIRDQLQSLPETATPEDLRPIARQLALIASRSDFPKKSLAAYRRHHAELPHLDVVLELAREEIAAIELRTPHQDVPQTDMRWLSVEAAAALLHISPAVVKERLRTRAGRRSLGWAWWDGHRWLIPEPAVNPETRAGYMASLPGEEPSAHVAALPEWCER